MINLTDCDIHLATHRANMERINATGWQAGPAGSRKKASETVAAALVVLAGRLVSPTRVAASTR